MYTKCKVYEQCKSVNAKWKAEQAPKTDHKLYESVAQGGWRPKVAKGVWSRRGHKTRRLCANIAPKHSERKQRELLKKSMCHGFAAAPLFHLVWSQNSDKTDMFLAPEDLAHDPARLRQLHSQRSLPCNLRIATVF